MYVGNGMGLLFYSALPKCVMSVTSCPVRSLIFIAPKSPSFSQSQSVGFFDSSQIGSATLIPINFPFPI